MLFFRREFSIVLLRPRNIMTRCCFILFSYLFLDSSNSSKNRINNHQKMEQSSQDFDDDLTQISQTQDESEEYRRGVFKKPKVSGSEDLFAEKPTELGQQSQYGEVILLGEVKRMENENTSKESMSPRAIRKSFCMRFHRQLEKLLEDMHPNYIPTPDERDLEVGLLCGQILDNLADRAFSRAQWAKDLMIAEIMRRSQQKNACR